MVSLPYAVVAVSSGVLLLIVALLVLLVHRRAPAVANKRFTYAMLLGTIWGAFAFLTRAFSPEHSVARMADLVGIGLLALSVVLALGVTLVFRRQH